MSKLQFIGFLPFSFSIIGEGRQEQEYSEEPTNPFEFERKTVSPALFDRLKRIEEERAYSKVLANRKLELSRKKDQMVRAVKVLGDLPEISGGFTMSFEDYEKFHRAPAFNFRIIGKRKGFLVLEETFN